MPLGIHGWTAAAKHATVATGLAIGVVASTSACLDTGGFTVLGRNESDQDVIVSITGDDPGSLRLPARTWGRLFVSFQPPAGDLKVFDGSCRPLTSVPFTQPDVTVRIAPDRVVELIGNQWQAPEGVRREEGEFPAARCP